MKHWLYCLLLASTLASPIWATEAERKIVVSAQGTAEAVPDMAVVQLTVNRQASTARQAVTDNSAAMGEVIDALGNLGIAERDLQTSNFSIQPRYSRPRPTSGVTEPAKLVGYTVRNSLTVRVRDVARVGEVLDAAVSLGVNEGGNIRFDNQQPAPVIEQARIRAVKQATAKAVTLADAAGVPLGDVIEIAENAERAGPRPVMRAMAAESFADSVPVATGENAYSVTVTLTFAIGD